MVGLLGPFSSIWGSSNRVRLVRAVVHFPVAGGAMGRLCYFISFNFLSSSVQWPQSTFSPHFYVSHLCFRLWPSFPICGYWRSPAKWCQHHFSFLFMLSGVTDGRCQKNGRRGFFLRCALNILLVNYLTDFSIFFIFSNNAKDFRKERSIQSLDQQ